ncbi:hypothetical protein [Butyrivibrio sp. NC2007]|uniref:hypothetical protein n=1 Tax=Butyrivibrio sp. NC2007 TaxID=1280683 RepID=UPI0003B3C9E4|nr:hypothetical protein [Butyrivibrio sp. NC2007]
MRITDRNKWVLLSIITFIQVMIIIYWGAHKENLYWDEYFTLEKAHYASNSTTYDHYITDEEWYGFEKWLPLSRVQETLVVTKEESVINDPIIDTIKKIFTRHNYPVFLNLAETILSPGELSIWPSIILNIIFFVLNQFVVFKLCQRLSNNQAFSIAACAFYGFSSMCISMTIFVRFYMLATLLVSLFTYLHLVYFDDDKYDIRGYAKRIMLLILMGVSLLLAYNDAQYSIIYAAFFVISFSVVLFIKKGVKEGFLYAIPVYGGGLFYLATRTEYLNILFDFENVYAGSEGALASTLDEIAGFRLLYLPGRISDMAFIFGKYVFGSFFVMLAVIVVVIVAMILRVAKANKESDENDDYFSPFILAIIGGTMAYIAFFTIFGLYEQVRYISFVFPELAIIVIYVVFCAIRKEKLKYFLVVALIILEVLSVNIKGKVDNKYTGDRENLERIRKYNADSLLLYSGAHTTFITYQAALMADENAEFYAYTKDIDGSIEHLRAQLRDNMLLVGYHGVDKQDVLDLLEEEGYKVEWLGDTYQFNVHSAVRQK